MIQDIVLSGWLTLVAVAYVLWGLTKLLGGED